MISNSEAADNREFDSASFDAVSFSDIGNRRGEQRSLQIFAAMVVVLAHAGLWWVLQWSSRPDLPRTLEQDALLIDFITRAATPAKLPEASSAAAPVVRVRAAERNASAIKLPADTEQLRPAKAPIAASAPEFYNDDGSVRVPAEVLADLAKLRGDDRQFDFQIPGLDRADALMRQRSPLEYRATRFDKDWRPNQDLLTELLNRAVEASTKEIRIPIPGDPRHHIVCRVSLLAMGGGCGVERNGADGDILPGHDDPETLSPEEDRACQAWWEKIVAAKTQDEWRQTRRLYEQECRKPLAREEVVP